MGKLNLPKALFEGYVTACEYTKVYYCSIWDFDLQHRRRVSSWVSYSAQYGLAVFSVTSHNFVAYVLGHSSALPGMGRRRHPSKALAPASRQGAAAQCSLDVTSESLQTKCVHLVPRARRARAIVNATHSALAQRWAPVCKRARERPSRSSGSFSTRRRDARET